MTPQQIRESIVRVGMEFERAGCKLTLNHERDRLYKAACEADTAWSNELHRLFGKRSGDVRYTKQGKGDPGTPLRKAHDRFQTANSAWMTFLRSA